MGMPGTISNDKISVVLSTLCTVLLTWFKMLQAYSLIGLDVGIRPMRIRIFFRSVSAWTEFCYCVHLRLLWANFTSKFKIDLQSSSHSQTASVVTTEILEWLVEYEQSMAFRVGKFVRVVSFLRLLQRNRSFCHLHVIEFPQEHLKIIPYVMLLSKQSV